jgi:hypothetical protein
MLLHGSGGSTIIQRPDFRGKSVHKVRSVVAASKPYETMSRPSSIILLAFAGLWLSGCVSSPWSAQTPASISPNTPAAAGTTPTAAPNQSDPRKMQDVMAELRQLGTADPAAQDQLMENLRQSDPSLWPLVMQQYRATAAYKRRAMERAAVANAQRLPPVDDMAVAPTEPPQGPYPSTSEPARELSPQQPQTSNQVAQVSYSMPVAEDWRHRLAATIAAMEADVPKNPTTPAEVAAHARLRMLYAAAGRREDAARPIPAAPPATQHFLAKELDGLTTWLNVEQTPDAARRAAETGPVLAEALGKLAESAPLLVRNLAFCTEVQSYGCAKRFEKYEFEPNQEVLLYAEVENFASEPTAKGFHTSLKSTYQIVDSRGRRVAENAFAATEEYCLNRRRDFFIGYHLRLPKGIAPGKYTLQLSIEDLKCQKAGQAAIEFEVKSKGEGGKGKAEPKAGA